MAVMKGIISQSYSPDLVVQSLLEFKDSRFSGLVTQSRK